MENWLIYTLIGLGAFIVSLFFEDVRDFYSEQLEMVWDGILYFFTFEWLSDFWDFISGSFEDIGEFSTYGLSFGVLAVVLIFYLRNKMIAPFVESYAPTGRIFWTISTYVVVFIGCYLLGKGFENSA